MKTRITAAAWACLLLLPLLAAAENSTRQAGYVVHHNAIPTALLTPEIASAYGIIRSKYRGMLSVSVIKQIPNTTGTAVTARIAASARNLTGQTREIDMREVREGEAIYYIGEFPIVHRELLTFTLDVHPENGPESIKAELSQEFFID
ncbi:MAG: DUF4426 domain-containing protein [Gammaproteobacteria bacterium]|nr:DUF4426 domain-containing protein [Gammaproteobacteria bacterium]